MKRLLGALLTLLLIPSAAAHGATPNDPKLEPALIRVPDLPAGFGAVGTDTGEDESILDVCNVPHPAPLGKTEVFYSAGGMFGTYVLSAVYRFPKGAAKTWMSEISKRLATKGRCAVVERTTDDGGTELTAYSALNVARIGDQSFGARGRDVTPDTGPDTFNLAGVTFDLIGARRGDLVAFVMVVQLDPSAPGADPVKLAKLTGSRLSKVR